MSGSRADGIMRESDRELARRLHRESSEELLEITRDRAASLSWRIVARSLLARRARLELEELRRKVATAHERADLCVELLPIGSRSASVARGARGALAELEAGLVDELAELEREDFYESE